MFKQRIMKIAILAFMDMLFEATYKIVAEQLLLKQSIAYPGEGHPYNAILIFVKYRKR